MTCFAAFLRSGWCDHQLWPSPHDRGLDADPQHTDRWYYALRVSANDRPDAHDCDAVPNGALAGSVAAGITVFLPHTLSRISPNASFPAGLTLGKLRLSPVPNISALRCTDIP